MTSHHYEHHDRTCESEPSTSALIHPETNVVYDDVSQEPPRQTTNPTTSSMNLYPTPTSGHTPANYHNWNLDPWHATIAVRQRASSFGATSRRELQPQQSPRNQGIQERFHWPNDSISWTNSLESRYFPHMDPTTGQDMLHRPCHNTMQPVASLSSVGTPRSSRIHTQHRVSRRTTRRNNRSPPLITRDQEQATGWICEWKDCSSNVSFQRGEDLLRHVRTVHIFPDKFKCDACSRRFGRQDNLQAHIQRIHQDEMNGQNYGA